MKKKRFKVLLHATVPTSAILQVEAKNAEEARDYAEVNWNKAKWDSGPDYLIPSGCDVEIGEIKEI